MATIFLSAIFFVTIDRLLKSLAISGFFLPSIEILGDVLKLSFKANYNIAFSLPLSGWWLNLLVILIIVSLLYYLVYLCRQNKYFLAFPLTFIIFGAISNMFDRLKYGFVIDYFDLKFYSVFNTADIMIVFGTILLIFILLRAEKH